MVSFWYNNVNKSNGICSMKNIVIASSNKGKIKEFSDIFNKLGVKIIPQTEFDVPDADEIGLSFIENAIIKARNCCKETGRPSIADDSGLEVTSLNGEPGIYSARYAGKHGDDSANIVKLLNNLGNSKNRKARFICALVFLKHENDPTPIVSIGELKGSITDKPIGNNGFGYDPVFLVPEYNMTLAQIDSNIKNSISHRANALRTLIEQFKDKI